MQSDFLIGCTYNFSQSYEKLTPIQRFQAVRDCDVFDYINWLPPEAVIEDCIEASELTGLPMTTGNCSCQIGLDEERLLRNVRNAARVKMRMLNVMLKTYAVDGHEITDDEIINLYKRADELGQSLGVKVSFEIHVDCWTEKYKRVTPIIRKMRAQGVDFALTVDYSHVIFKINNFEQQDISGVREDVAARAIVLDPYEDGNLCQEWLSEGVVTFAQFRPVSPHNPINLWAQNPDGSAPRGIMYPFLRPGPGEWHSPWFAHELAACKEAFRLVMRHHLSNSSSPLKYVITEMIPSADYGMNAKFSLLEHNAACARWIRSEWNHLKSMHQAGLALKV
jgi:hypothetical protein